MTHIHRRSREPRTSAPSAHRGCRIPEAESNVIKMSKPHARQGSQGGGGVESRVGTGSTLSLFARRFALACLLTQVYRVSLRRPDIEIFLSPPLSHWPFDQPAAAGCDVGLFTGHGQPSPGPHTDVRGAWPLCLQPCLRCGANRRV